LLLLLSLPPITAVPADEKAHESAAAVERNHFHLDDDSKEKEYARQHVSIPNVVLFGVRFNPMEKHNKDAKIHDSCSSWWRRLGMSDESRENNNALQSRT